MTLLERKAQLLEWDTAFWGFNVAHADSWRGWEIEGPGFFQCLRPIDDLEGISDHLGWGFHIADVRVTLDTPVRDFVIAGSDSGVRFYEETDLEHLVRIARESHRITRYYADPEFVPDRCDDLYETWIRNSAAGWADQVLVTGHPAHGYVTIHLEDREASIGLIAVDKDARGQGAGYRLVHGALRWAHTAGATRMEVVTQGRNIQAQRLFQRCGFRTAKTELWLHSWR